MADSRVEYIVGLGAIRIQKKRGLKRISMRLHSSGEVRVSQPFYLPFSAGLHFARLQSAWIIKQKKKHQPLELYNGLAIGKQRQLRIINDSSIRTRITKEYVTVYYPELVEPTPDQRTIELTKKAIKRALNEEAKSLLPQRVEQLAKQYDYTYTSITIKPLKSRWGACSSTKDLTFNCYLMMLPWDIIDYVIMHELSHTKHMNHSAVFWQEVATSTPNYAFLKQQLKQLQPKVHAFYV